MEHEYGRVSSEWYWINGKGSSKDLFLRMWNIIFSRSKSTRFSHLQRMNWKGCDNMDSDQHSGLVWLRFRTHAHTIVSLLARFTHFALAVLLIFKLSTSDISELSKSPVIIFPVPAGGCCCCCWFS